MCPWILITPAITHSTRNQYERSVYFEYCRHTCNSLCSLLDSWSFTCTSVRSPSNVSIVIIRSVQFSLRETIKSCDVQYKRNKFRILSYLIVLSFHEADASLRSHMKANLLLQALIKEKGWRVFAQHFKVIIEDEPPYRHIILSRTLFEWIICGIIESSWALFTSIGTLMKLICLILAVRILIPNSQICQEWFIRWKLLQWRDFYILILP